MRSKPHLAVVERRNEPNGTALDHAFSLFRHIPEVTGVTRVLSYRGESFFENNYSNTDALLNWAILGNGQKPEGRFIATFTREGRHVKGCDIYIGIRSPHDERGRFKLGERGYEMAQRAGKPALILDRYDNSTIRHFVKELALDVKRV